MALFHESEYPGRNPGIGTLEEFVDAVSGGLVEVFYLKMAFVPNDDDDEDYAHHIFMALLEGNTNLKALKKYHYIPVGKRRFGIIQINLIWRTSACFKFLDLKEFPVDRMWRLLLDFAPKHGFKFRRTEYEGLSVRAHFHKDVLPF
jgi:hypothetical protein